MGRTYWFIHFWVAFILMIKFLCHNWPIIIKYQSMLPMYSLKKNCSHCFFSAKIFQKTKCSMCNSPLELPSVHFLCGHSFHQHCLESFAESEAECPTCTPENRKVMDMLRAQDQKRDLHDHFHRQVLIFLLQLELVKKNNTENESWIEWNVLFLPLSFSWNALMMASQSSLIILAVEFLTNSLW